ncbi:MAG: methyltransferase domain-containing protein [Chloroflexi bacterium]|nr:methyltransferase domain-containing protein [Chloroflexota bacterium]
MPSPDSLRDPRDVYDGPGMAWSLRSVGAHLHPGSESATVALADRAAAHGFAAGGRVLEMASALGAPARFLARRFAATVVCVDMDRRMHAAAVVGHRSEGLGLRCQPVLGRTERLPLAGGSMDAAWSQDALCHMDKPAVVAEVARVLKPGAIFAFSDWIAMSGFTAGDRDSLSRLWGFPSLLRIPEYVALLDGAGFEVLLAEDRTRALLGARLPAAADQELWLESFAARFGKDAVARQREPSETWAAMIEGGRSGYGMFVARRR